MSQQKRKKTYQLKQKYMIPFLKRVTEMKLWDTMKSKLDIYFSFVRFDQKLKIRGIKNYP